MTVKLKPSDCISQTVKGLKPGTSYTLSAAMRTGASTAILSPGVTNFGRPTMMVITPKGMSYAPGYLTFTTGPNSTSLDIYISNWGGNTQPQYAYNLILRQAGY